MESVFYRPTDSSPSEEEDGGVVSPVVAQDSAGPSIQPHAAPSSPALDNVDPQANPLTLYSPLHPDIPFLPPNHRTALLISSLLESHINSRLPNDPNLAGLMHSEIAQQLTALGITPPNSELFSRGELSIVRQSLLEGIDSLMQQSLEKRRTENMGNHASNSLAGDGQMSMVRHESNRPPLRRMMTDLPSGRNMDGRKVIHKSSSLNFLASAAKQTKYRPSTAPALAESPPSFFSVDPPPESIPARMMILKTSRYMTDFVELGRLGKGGFGTVYRVQNRLDQQEYAVKKIVLKNKLFQKMQDDGIEAFEKVMKEVNTMAKLEHVNIVRYYSSWIDGLTGEQFIAPMVPVKVDAEVSVLDTAGVIREAEMLLETPNNEELLGAVIDRSDGGVVFAYSDDGEDRVQTLEDSFTESKGMSKDPKVDEENEDSAVSSNTRDEGPSDESVEVIPRSYPPKVKLATNNPTSPRLQSGHKRNPKVVFDISARASSLNSESEFTESMYSAGTGAMVRSTPRTHGKHQRTSSASVITLHIQMSLHPLVLTAYLLPPYPSPSTPEHCFCLEAALKLFLGLVDGVDYLHQRGIAHRDLKPGNVFLDIVPGKSLCKCRDSEVMVVPKIGDFGLVKNIGEATAEGVHGSSAVGTEHYRPPPGTPDENDVVWRDIFALGVILLELVCKFGTRMERLHILTLLTRDGKLPVGLEERVAEIIRGCCGLGPYFRHKWDMKRVKKAAMDIVAAEVGE